MRCRIYRWVLTGTMAEDKPLSKRLKRHLQACEPCRDHHVRIGAMQQQLRQDLPDAPPLSTELGGRILEAIRSGTTSRPDPLPRPALRFPGRLVLAAAAAACVLLGVALVVLSPPVEPPRTPIVELEKGKQTVEPAIAPGPEDLTSGFWADVEQLAAAPVADEMRRMADDTRQIGSALLAQLPLELVGAGDGELIDALLGGLTDTPAPAPPPASRPSPSKG